MAILAPTALWPIAQLGAAIRQLRQSRTELRIEGFAEEEAGVHRTTLSTIERGLGNPTWDMLCTLATVMKVEVHEIAELPARVPPDAPKPGATAWGRKSAP